MAAQSHARPPLQHTTARHQHPLFSEIIQPLNPQNTQKTSILARKIAQSLHSFTKSRTFAPQLRTRGARLKMLKQTLGYGVMVTQQILVLFFLVRVRVSQQKRDFILESLFFVYSPYTHRFFLMQTFCQCERAMRT